MCEAAGMILRVKFTRALCCLVAACIVVASISARAGGEVAHGKPDPLRPMAEGDIAVRVNYVGSLALYSTWLTLRRVAGKSDASYAIEADFAAIPQPHNLTQTQSWDVVWNRLQGDGFLDLPGNQMGKGCAESVPLDAGFVIVEVQRGANYRKFGYYEPGMLNCGDAKSFMSTLEFLQGAFGDQLPVPYSMTGCKDGKCPGSEGGA